MILRTPQLALKRLLIQSRGVSVYDENFHLGVNIIRGTNSSGLRRIVKIGGKQPVLIFYGDLATALKSPVEGWQLYSMVRSEAKESFSQTLFRLLEFPEVKTDMENSITMHQLLRVMYVDQLSPVDALLRFEAFDPPLTRETVGDLLLGLYDDFLYNELREHREKQKILESITDKLEGLYKAVKETEIEIDEEALNKRLAAIGSELVGIEKALAESSTNELEKVALPDLRKQIDSLVTDLRQTKVALSNAAQEADSLELEIADSEAFINELKNRLAAVGDSLTTRHSLGELQLTHCPHCLSLLKEKPDKKLCALCGNELPENPTDSKALRMKQELAQQLKESERLIEDKRQALTLVQVRLPELKTAVKTRQRQYEEAVQKVRPARDEKIDRLLVRKGELTAETENINKQIKLAALLKSYEAQKATLTSTIQALGLSIERRKRTQAERRSVGRQAIEQKTLFLLKNDLPREEMLRLGKTVDADFKRNTFALDGINQFSASTVVYLKNSIHYAIFFSSLDLAFFRYPRFILCDNMEDKGMEQERSRNFQKLIVSLSGSSEVRHQIIFTTSMIDPALNNDNYCVGPEYTDQRKSLAFPKPPSPKTPEITA